MTRSLKASASILWAGRDCRLEGFVRKLHDVNALAASIRADLSELDVYERSGLEASFSEVAVGTLPIKNQALFDALTGVSEQLGLKYAQVCTDIESTNRLTWSGTAHAIREIVVWMLRILAPDDDVVQQIWYVKVPDTHGPTHAQRVRYILEQKNADGSQHSMMKELDLVDERVTRLVRSTYSRASNAAHRSRDLGGVRTILRYFEAFTADLLGLG